MEGARARKRTSFSVSAFVTSTPPRSSSLGDAGSSACAFATSRHAATTKRPSARSAATTSRPSRPAAPNTSTASTGAGGGGGGGGGGGEACLAVGALCCDFTPPKNDANAAATAPAAMDATPAGEDANSWSEVTASGKAAVTTRAPRERLPPPKDEATGRRRAAQRTRGAGWTPTAGRWVSGEANILQGETFTTRIEACERRNALLHWYARDERRETYS